ncbi:hypothetical protein JCM8202_002234 [Rhodotorula sphaerocarpa]
MQPYLPARAHSSSEPRLALGRQTGDRDGRGDADDDGDTPREHANRAHALHAAMGSQAGWTKAPAPRQLPPGAAYAADHVPYTAPGPFRSPQPQLPSPAASAAPSPPYDPWFDQQRTPTYAPGQSGQAETLPARRESRDAAGLGDGGSSGAVRPLDLGWKSDRPAQTFDRADSRISLASPVSAGAPAAADAPEGMPWSISLQEPTPPPSQHLASASTDTRQTTSRRASMGVTAGEPPNFSRPTLPSTPSPAETAPPRDTEETLSSNAVTVRENERTQLLGRDSFVGIAGGRLPASAEPAEAEASARPPTIPAFTPAPAFSPEDRGPYPPISGNPAAVRRDSAAEGMLGGSAAAYPPVIAGAPFGAPELPPDLGRPGSLAFDASAFSADMAGIGRNSVIRAAASPPLATPTSPPLDAAGALAASGGSAARSPDFVQQASGQALSNAQQAPAVSGQPFAFPNSALVLPNPPPHLVPQPEICVECMMRDRDMADVDVTTPGVWDRASDIDYEEQMRWEAEEQQSHSGGSGTPVTGSWSGEHPSSVESATMASKRRESSAAYSRESLGGRSSVAHGSLAPRPRRRLGHGQLLTSGNLKVWTTMNPPAASHRWRTLQTYLATQAHYLELDRQSRDAEGSQSLPVRPTQHAVRPSQGSRSWSSSVLSPSAHAADKVAFEAEDRRRRAGKGRTSSRGTLADEPNRLSSASLLPPPGGPPVAPRRATVNASSGASMRSHSSGDQPALGNQLRRVETPGRDPQPSESPRSTRFNLSAFTRSAVDLRADPSPRSTSPARTNDDRRMSVWSRFRRSGSASVLSFAPSGSMVDMHLGLSQDKHPPYTGFAPYETYPSRSDPAVARHAETAQREQALAASQATGESGDPAGGKKKRKGIKGLFNKLVHGGNGKKASQASLSAPATPGADMTYDESLDDSELAPPPPLSALANEPQYHHRSASNSSVDSFGPVTPPVPGGPTFRVGGGPGFESGSLRLPADRQSMMSFNSARSRPVGPAAGYDSGPSAAGWPSADSLRDPAAIDPSEHEVLAGPEDEPNDAYGSLAAPLPGPQKSLPHLPSMDGYAARRPLEAYGDPNVLLPTPHAPYADYGAARSAQSIDQSNFTEEFGYDARPASAQARHRSATIGVDGRTADRGGRNRSKIFSMSFGRKSKQVENTSPPTAHPGVRSHSFDAGVALGAGPYRNRAAVASGYL